MNVDAELKEAREFEYPEQLRLLKHIAMYAPENYDVIRDPDGIGYDQPYGNLIIQELITSGIKMPPMSAPYSFLL
jgi:hypothetical protein